MVNNPLSGFGLRQITFADQNSISTCLRSVSDPLSDYTFSQLYTWSSSLRILWTQLDGHLCVFANGCGPITMLIPPIGGDPSKADSALRQSFDLMDAYNRAHGVDGAALRESAWVEYVSSELVGQFSAQGYDIKPMGADYIYDTARMIDLAGGDLASKRQLRSRFVRNYRHRVEPYSTQKHRDDCLKLMDSWRDSQDQRHALDSHATAAAQKRLKETVAVSMALDHADALGLCGLVVYVEQEGVERLAAFTLGEPLGSAASISVEKTDLSVKGLAQFIFAEFCRQCWSSASEINVSDDWGLPSLAWTKQSYRPRRLLSKFEIRRLPVAMSGWTPAARPVGNGADPMSARSLTVPADRASVFATATPADPAAPATDWPASMQAAMHAEIPAEMPTEMPPVPPLIPAPPPEPVRLPELHADTAAGAGDALPAEPDQCRETAQSAEDINGSIRAHESRPAVDSGATASRPAASDPAGTDAAGVSTQPRRDPLVPGGAIVVRPATRFDLQGAEQLEQTCFRVHQLSRRQLRYLQKRPGVVFLVADNGTEIVGDCIALVRQHRRGRSARIYSLAVREAFRGRGIGRMLLAAMLDALDARGVHRTFLEVESANRRAISLYLEQGFTTIGDLPDYYGPGQPGSHMMRVARVAQGSPSSPARPG